MSNYKPDKWTILEINGNRKVLGGWSGGYLDSDNWRLSSGVKKIEKKDGTYFVHNHSGSVYECKITCEGMTALSASIYRQIEEMCEKENKTLKIVDRKDFNEE